jgi:hypothetical protein
VSRWDLGRLATRMRSEILSFAKGRSIPWMRHASFRNWHREYTNRQTRYNELRTVEEWIEKNAALRPDNVR